MAYCGNCGNEIATPFCQRCGAPAGVSVATSRSKVTDEPPRPNGFYRSPALVCWFTAITFGVYGYYYLIRSRRIARRRLGESEETYWTAFKLVIPIYGLVYFFRCWTEIGRRVQASGVVLPVPVAVQAIGFFLANILWRLPDSVWVWFYVAGFASIGTIHASVARAERVDEPDYRWPRLAVAEWIILVVGSIILYPLCALGLSMDSDGGVIDWNRFAYLMGATAAVIILFQVLFANIARPAVTASTRSGLTGMESAKSGTLHEEQR